MFSTDLITWGILFTGGLSCVFMVLMFVNKIKGCIQGFNSIQYADRSQCTVRDIQAMQKLQIKRVKQLQRDLLGSK